MGSAVDSAFRNPPPPKLDGPVQPMKRGGRRKREHHDFGDIISGIGSTLLNTAPMWLPMLLKKGGPARRNKKK